MRRAAAFVGNACTGSSPIPVGLSKDRTFRAKAETGPAKLSCRVPLRAQLQRNNGAGDLAEWKNRTIFVPGEMAEWAIAAVLKTVELRGSGGSNPSLSATNAENQQIAKQTPSFTPKNVKSGVFVLFKIIQPLHNKRVAILKESDEKRLIFIYPFTLIFQDFTSS